MRQKKGRRLSKLYAREDAHGKCASQKKSKTSWGGQAVDYEKIAAAAVQAMKPADINRFLVVCALVSDLYCPGFNPRQPLVKESNLARTAIWYKVELVKAAAGVREELTRKKSPSLSKATSNKNSEKASAENRKRSTAKKQK